MEIEIDKPVCEELAEVEEWGGESTPKGEYFARVAENPIGISLRRVFRECGIVIPEIEELRQRGRHDLLSRYRSFETWLIPHSLQIVRRSGSSEVLAVGVEVQFNNGNATCSVLSLIPECKYIEQARAAGTLSASGELSIPKINPIAAKCISLLGIDFGLHSKADFSVQFNVNVITPYISAVGKHSSHCEWRFDRHEEPLHGRDIECWSVIALPKWQRQIDCSIRFYIEWRWFAFSRRYESAWVNVLCRLD